jgi:chitosanase
MLLMVRHKNKYKLPKKRQAFWLFPMIFSLTGATVTTFLFAAPKDTPSGVVPDWSQHGTLATSITRVHSDESLTTSEGTNNVNTSPSTPGSSKKAGTPGSAPTTAPKAKASSGPTLDLSNATKKDIAMRLVSSAENSSLDWRAQFKYIEDIGDGRGYTGGIIGFCSGTSDMLALVEYYTQIAPDNILAKYLPALRAVDGTASHAGLDPNFAPDWRTAANDAQFQNAQEHERDRQYFNPAVAKGKADGLGTLGQFIYYDAYVMHGGISGMRTRAIAKAKPPAQGGDETAYLNAFLDERVKEMKKEEAHSDTSRVDTAQRKFLNEGNLGLNTPLSWSVYGDHYSL